MEIRNIAIIAHVDHGKTTLTDALLKQSGMVEEGFTMDINKLEQERGITIYSKNTSLFYPSIHSTSAQDGEQGRTTSSESSQATTKINIVDTPGHADFGSEVERVLRAIDSVLLVVDAGEGPMPQTRFVLKKSLELGLKPIVVINKIDKPAARPEKVHEEILELFLELGANEEQLDFKTIYAIGRQGIAKRNLSDQSTNLNPLLDLILEQVPSASTKTENDFVAQVFNLAYDNFLGRLAIVRIYGGKIKSGEQIFVKKAITNETRKAKITKLFTFEGMSRKDVPEVSAGDIVIIAGIPDIYIGETITSNENEIALPSIAIDEPTISLNFLVNDSPFAGQDGKFVTSRQIKERLEKELEVNVGLKVDFSAFGGKVSGRGELHIAVLLENMRREGYELQVSQPQVIIKETDGKKFEPYEEVIIDVPEETSGAVIEKITKRRGVMQEMNKKEGIMHLRFEMPTRGLLGYKSQFIIDTKGEGILSSRVIGFKPHAGEIKKREVGSMTSMEKGTAVAFALDNLQNRGIIYIEPGTEVYEGMVIGNVLKGDEMAVNPTKGKQLTNVRASGTDEAIFLKPAYLLTIERGLEIMAGDEYLEVTPKNVRLRKKFLTERDRAKAVR
ncbi:GTP-binding protein TypA [Candidatus Nomurabacteria bacterium RIFCSPLOWO2_01_FULL_42_20]|uniref:50S ribosomal subunit assembly factor BipA n=1 Tax=Candidatus Nomurabacteria bacterium RIFCSPHIGHO2_01_FULL_42_16 TaxID=1801743 RepID=A0A1F6VM16_9BACT|nr:MAG: GTP-binding protein TypA [Candidatus Nomurabacteria bacterium RIFCSPHIGHO2_01_FULL_42_16]OGI91352.1 MAG: GTP-binding protein TypA [Candidatus Nomurabacteria bacterium RIFCSPLOWO2_01_FULL_42_20]